MVGKTQAETTHQTLAEDLMLKRILQAAIRLVAKDYWNGSLYTTQPPQNGPAEGPMSYAAIEDSAELARSCHQELRIQALAHDADAWAFGAWVQGELAAVCWLYARETLRKRGGLFRLAPDEAELAQVTTAQSFRGRGVATNLIQYAAWQMGLGGFRKLYAKIWHDNKASVQAFERAGWKLEKRFFSLTLRCMHRPVILRLR
jgi:GNAT superfamily N-acetyltransferase